MNGSEPPSSNTHFFNAAPAWAPMAIPARTLPVSVTAAMRESAIALETPSGVTLMTSKTPSGNSARLKASSNR
ncbi:hypothetical protein D3C84_1162860 [compost metagenome]